MEQTIEVDAKLVFGRVLKLRAVSGDEFEVRLDVFECSQPYVLVFVVTRNENSVLRMDVHKDDLSRELRRWLEGSSSRTLVTAANATKRLDDHIMKFIKFGNPPAQEVLFQWILTRTEISWDDDHPYISFGGIQSNNNDSDSADDYVGRRVSHHYDSKSNATFQRKPSLQKFHLSVRDNSIFDDDHDIQSTGSSKSRSRAELQTFHMKNTVDIDTSTFDLTRKLLGKSKALDMLKQSRRSTSKQRDGAVLTSSIGSMSLDQFVLGADIEKTRKEIADAMEIRRRTIEISKVRQQQVAAKYNIVRDSIKLGKQGDNWNSIAFEELINLRKTKDEVEQDINKQRIKAQKNHQLLSWTMAPPGFNNHRGKSMPGYPIGDGPLPFTATSSLKDPMIESAAKKYYWDIAGRRHIKDYDHDENENQSMVEQALDAIRKAAQNVAAYKLDLKGVFASFDSSGDGYLNKEEMADAFLALGVPLDIETSEILFKHFDPNGSGSVHYGEFQWAFFNRRSLARKYKRHTIGLSESQIICKFHRYDINGDGVLSVKEFRRLLLDFEIKLANEELQVLIDRFDHDGDGEIDMHEFKEFIEAEVNQLGDTLSVGASTTSLRSSSTSPHIRSSHQDNHNKSSVSETASMSDSKSEMILRQMLKVQSKLETKLGKKYFHTII